MILGVDAMGGDFAPLEAIKGAALAKLANPEWEIVLFGKQAEILSVCASENINTNLFTLVHCPEVIGMSEHPVKAMASKRESSLAVGFMYLAENKVDAMISAGNTGAMLVGSLQSVQAIPGILRPCLTSILPRLNNHPGLLLDVGANSDVKPEHLAQFALLGSIYYQAVYHVAEPKVALLNIGEEDEKGSILTKAANKLLRETGGFNFVGNVEGRDIFSDDFDVIVCDGFTGNVLLKVCEGMYYRLAKRGIQDEFLDKFNFKHYGGSSVLGVNAPVIVGHGISKSETFVKMIELAAEQVKSEMTKTVRMALEKFGNKSAEA